MLGYLAAAERIAEEHKRQKHEDALWAAMMARKGMQGVQGG